jgi:hypothetical protein
MTDQIKMETSVVHPPLTRRSVVTVVLNGGDLKEREALAQNLLTWVGAQSTPAAEPIEPALSAVFALLAKQAPATPDADALLPISSGHAITPLSPYDEPFLLAPLEVDRLVDLEL